MFLPGVLRVYSLMRAASREFAIQQSWTDVKTSFFGSGARGRWRGLRVAVSSMIPTRKDYRREGSVKITIKIGGKRFVIRPRGSGSVWTRPITIVGPRLLDPSEVAGSQAFYVCARDVDMMRTLFADPRVVALMEGSQATVESREGKLSVEFSVPSVTYEEAQTMTQPEHTAAWISNAMARTRAAWDVASAVAARIARFETT